MYVELLHGEGLVSRMALDIFLVASLCVPNLAAQFNG